MKLALIGSIQTVNMSHAYSPNYKMYLAQYIKSYQPYYYDDYHTFYINRRRGRFVILDNGTPEGNLQTNGYLKEVYDIVQPDELVLPDVWEDGRASVKSAIAFLEDYHIPARKRMVVPQGLNMDEWKESLTNFIGEIEFATIGIPKHLDGKEGGGRVEALRWIEEMGWHDKYHVHLLGCYENPVREVREIYAIAPWVRGIDTAAPYAYAQAKEDIQCGHHIGYEWNKDFDEEIASMNIDKLIAACQGK